LDEEKSKNAGLAQKNSFWLHIIAQFLWWLAEGTETL
jgi:hypothetical protein